ncbi:bladder cancer-associated protein [Gymnodraco acuticeps]|uniref:Bladder cancer-associated protein n=8 Tax=Notothenioidei TaxID=8205 RepID=A0A6P8UE71_GYMAC|nr:PREDICTED: bladder cancer-associated protein [Notothenia coriiceps]XP_033939464.1 bladder cancer-associated protein [Pseudochaenichthys georgianus]XP_033939465.1 bladder cancer-associated protein [Pseudochaenichthys georgianus]XP_034005806.1 bladder cancer-associated protein [Trematomus bernacchii]XP_034005807.1 bladder cancer-associated protein [Trematomus bernacchii]XP_034064622.1 bladder cancer-associated protein [Gymnodraco acuticeps]XP_034064623.1 bladder cancer-associated protein [Gy
MYCLQWLLPVLLIPKPLNPALWFNHSMFMGFYLLSFLLERKPCTICALVFLAALFLICYSCWGNCFLYHCQDTALPDSAHDPAIVGT